MAAPSQGLRVGIQVLLALIIVALSYWLYRSIIDPYKVIEEQERLTEVTRSRMANIRTAMIQYQERNNRFTTSLDSLRFFLQDSLSQAQRDSLFGPEFVIDSVFYSARAPQQFNLQVVDTSRVKTYLLEDPTSDDYIGTLDQDVTRINAASWE